MSENNLFNINEVLTPVNVKVKNTINSITGIYNCYSYIGKSTIDFAKNYVESLKNLCSIFAIPITDTLFIGIYHEDLVNVYNCVIHDVNNGLSSINQLFDSLNIPINTNLFEKSFYDNKAQVENINTVRVLLEKMIEFTRNIANMIIDGGITVTASIEIYERMKSFGKEWNQARFERAMFGMTKENIELFHKLFNSVVNLLQLGLKLLNLIVALFIDFPLSELSVQILYTHYQNLSNTTNVDEKIQGLLLNSELQSSETLENKINSIFKDIETEITNALNEITNFVEIFYKINANLNITETANDQTITETTKEQINNETEKYQSKLIRLLYDIKTELKTFSNNIRTTVVARERLDTIVSQKTLNLEEKNVKKSEYSQEYGLAARPFTVKSLHIQGITFLPFLKRFHYI